MRTLILLIGCWAVGLAAYAGALRAVHGEVMSISNWTVVGLITLDAWLIASVLITLPLLRQLSARRSNPPGAAVVVGVGVILAIVPLWLTLTLWYGWHLRNLVTDEAGLLGVLYGTSSIVLGLRLTRRAASGAA